MLIPNYWQQFMHETEWSTVRCAVFYCFFYMVVWKREPISKHPDAVSLIFAVEESLQLANIFVHNLILM